MSLSERVLGKLSREKSKILNTYLLPRLVAKQPHLEDFDYERFETDILNFVKTLRVEGSFSYRYSHASNNGDLYSTIFAVMTHSLFNKVDDFAKSDKKGISKYIQSSQRSDGLFYDASFDSASFRDGEDWWGPRNLTLHALNALHVLGEKPNAKLRFLDPYINGDDQLSWLESRDFWFSDRVMDTDLDNKIMNVGCIMQYNRDVNGCSHSAAALDALKAELRDRLNTETGIWGGRDIMSPRVLSRKVQFSYHLFPLFTRDDDFNFDRNKIIECALRTQNTIGGFGTKINSSACEDIDSIEILTRFYPFVGSDLQNKIDIGLRKAFRSILTNRNKDNGFSFKANEKFVFGVPFFTEHSRRSSSFATWFRTLSLAYICSNFSDVPGFYIRPLYGYEF